MSHVHEPDELDVHDENGSVPASILDALRERRREQVADRYFDLDVPGYRGQLVLRCRPIRGQVFTRLRERMERSRSPERDFNLNADTLIAACSEVLARARVEDPLLVLATDGEPIKLGKQLGQLLDVPSTSARDVVREVFHGAPSPELAVGAAAGRYMSWATALDAETDDDYLGESPAAPN